MTARIATENPRSRTSTHAIALAAVMAFSAAYMTAVIMQGWVPFDEGTLGQSAHRVLIGQLPHRDFDEVYTGGLTFLHALAFRVLGQNLAVLRKVLFVAILLVMPAFYYIASRLTRPALAAGLSIVALIVSFPSYPAAMPSWYNLIFAVTAVAALFRFIDTGRRRWVLAAGVCAGLSVLAKIVGVYLCAALALFLVFHAFAPTTPADARPRARRSFLTIGLSLAIVGLAAFPFAIMSGRLRWPETPRSPLQSLRPVLLLRSKSGARPDSLFRVSGVRFSRPRGCSLSGHSFPSHSS